VPQRASLVCGVVFAWSNAGVLLATFVNLSVQELLPFVALPGWGWRIGFLVRGLLGFRLRRALEETPTFAQMQCRVARLPLREVITAHPWPVLVGIATTAAAAGFNGLLFVHMPGYWSVTCRTSLAAYPRQFCNIDLRQAQSGQPRREAASPISQACDLMSSCD
jgi:hypothetical protein